jgi:hypothetical protein
MLFFQKDISKDNTDVSGEGVGVLPFVHLVDFVMFIPIAIEHACRPWVEIAYREASPTFEPH